MLTSRLAPNWIAVCVMVGMACSPDLKLADGDAIATSQAAQAPTIMEVFVGEDEIRVEIEVDHDDLAAFAELVPDDEWKVLPFRPTEAFADIPWQIRVDDQPLVGELVHVSVGPRTEREAIIDDNASTLIEGDEVEDEESVLKLTLTYPLATRPESITLHAPQRDARIAATIGFVCHHKQIPVNDFRYLPNNATVDLDWDDPWYSRFRNRNLEREYDAPLSAFLYIEPFEVRKEIIARPRDLQAWIDLGLDNTEVIPVADQPELKRKVAEFLQQRGPVMIDGQPVEGQLDRVHFIRRTLQSTGVIEPPVELSVDAATLGLIFVYPMETLPQEVSMQWDLFNSRIQEVPGVATDETGGLPAQLTSADPTLQWTNTLTNPTIPRLRVIEPPPPPPTYSIPLVSCVCGCLAVAMLVPLTRRIAASNGLPKWMLGILLASVGGALVTFPFARVSVANPFVKPPALSEADADDVVTSLLHNVYRAFDHHNESLVYDRLSESISGDLLQQVYLETRQSMEVKNQGGLRISVKEVEVTKLELVNMEGTDSTFRCRWHVSGEMGHWGHVHQRENVHTALITVAPRDERWKIVALEMLDEETVETARALQEEPA